jgi:tetratricopeptide (TPR) repeat protein
LTGIDRSQLQAGYLPYPTPIIPGVPPPSAISPDAKLFASVLRSDGNLYECDNRSQSHATTTVEVRDVATGRVLRTLIGHTADVICITDPAQANSVAWYCVLAPDAVSNREAPMRLAAAALAGHPKSGRELSDVLSTVGATLYRAGRFGDAIRCLNQSIQAHGDEGDPKGFAFLALAHHRLGHRDEAKRWLDKLVASRPKEGFDFSSDDVEVRILRREPESLILGRPPAAARRAIDR